VTELERACLALTVAKDMIQSITGVEVDVAHTFDPATGGSGQQFKVHILNDKTFDTLAAGRDVTVAELEPQIDGVWVKRTFEMFGVQFKNLKREV
jgi:hypothetical protein